MASPGALYCCYCRPPSVLVSLGQGVTLRRQLASLMDDVARRDFAKVYSSPHGAAALELSNLRFETGADGDLRFVPQA